MIFYIEDKEQFESISRGDIKGKLFVKKVDNDKVALLSDNLKGEVSLSLFKMLICDLIKYYDVIILNWKLTLPSFSIGSYPEKGKYPKTLIRYGGKILGINPFIQNMVGDIVKAIANNLKHKNKQSDMITIDFMENSIDNKE